MKILKYGNKKMNVNLMALILLFIMFVLFGFNTNNVDMPAYKSIYNLYVEGQVYLSSHIEIGFKLIFYSFGRLGLSYQWLLIFISISGLFLIYNSIKKYTDKASIVLLLFFLFPFFHQITIIRNFTALSISFFSINYLIEKNYIKYIIGILIASLFHQSAIINLIFLLANIDYKKIDRYIFCISIIVITILFIPTFQNLVVRFFPKLIIYMLGSTRNITKIAILLHYSIMLLLGKYLFKKELINKKNYHISILMYKCLKIGFLFVPLSMISMDFFRLIENIMLLFYIIIANTNLISNGKMKMVSVTLTLFIFFQILIFEIWFSFGPIIYMVLENNLLWK